MGVGMIGVKVGTAGAGDDGSVGFSTVCSLYGTIELGVDRSAYIISAADRRIGAADADASGAPGRRSVLDFTGEMTRGGRLEAGIGGGAVFAGTAIGIGGAGMIGRGGAGRYFAFSKAVDWHREGYLR